MKYNVIIVLDESRNRSYYDHYVAENGNIECTDLPPYQDINKARSCFWDGEKWIYDADKYAEIVAARQAEKTAAEQKQRELEAIPSNTDLMLGLMDVADKVSLIIAASPELTEKIVSAKGGE